MGGYDPRDDKVKKLAFVCLCGNKASDIVKDTLADPLARAMGTVLIKKIPTEVVKRINRAVGMRLVTKFGENGVLNLGKAILFFRGDCWWNYRRRNH